MARIKFINLNIFRNGARRYLVLNLLNGYKWGPGWLIDNREKWNPLLLTYCCTGTTERNEWYHVLCIGLYVSNVSWGEIHLSLFLFPSHPPPPPILPKVPVVTSIDEGCHVLLRFFPFTLPLPLPCDHGLFWLNKRSGGVGCFTCL